MSPLRLLHLVQKSLLSHEALDTLSLDQLSRDVEGLHEEHGEQESSGHPEGHGVGLAH